MGAGQILLHTLIVSNCCCRDSFGRLLPTTGLDFQWMDKKKRILTILITLLITIPSPEVERVQQYSTQVKVPLHY